MKPLIVELDGYRDTKGRFAKRSQELDLRKRETVLSVLQEIVIRLQDAAPQRTGKFAGGIAYISHESNGKTEGSICSTGEHAFVLPFLVDGTRPHPIPTGGAIAQMAKGYPLRFFWEKGPTGPHIYYFWAVRHPGIKPNEKFNQAIEESKVFAANEFRKVARRVAWLS